jgi:threonine dehydratase
VTVEDRQIIDAVLWLESTAKIVVEPSGAASVAAALAGAGIPGPTVAIISGGNIDMERLEEFRRSKTTVRERRDGDSGVASPQR